MSSAVIKTVLWTPRLHREWDCRVRVCVSVCVYACVCVHASGGRGSSFLMNHGESLQEHACQRKKWKGGRGGGGGGAAPLWMISVSCAAGYGKFTQTNDSHLQEARDTMAGGAYMSEPWFHISPSAWGEMFTLLPLWCSHRSHSAREEPWTPPELGQ